MKYKSLVSVFLANPSNRNLTILSQTDERELNIQMQRRYTIAEMKQTAVSSIGEDALATPLLEQATPPPRPRPQAQSLRLAGRRRRRRNRRRRRRRRTSAVAAREVRETLRSDRRSGRNHHRCSNCRPTGIAIGRVSFSPGHDDLALRNSDFRRRRRRSDGSGSAAAGPGR